MPIRMCGGMHGHSRRVDYEPRFAVIADRIDLSRRQTWVHGHGPSVETADSQQDSRKFPAVFTDNHDSITSSHSGTAEPVRSPRDDPLQFPIRPAAVWINNSFMIGQTVRPRLHYVGYAHGH